MTNIIDSIINYTLCSKYNTLNKIGNTLYINRQMSINREKFITEKVNGGTMRNILMEMKLLLNGRYAGNKEYLFERMDYLINCAIERQPKNKKNIRLTVNKKPVKELRTPKKLNRCKKSGRFLAKKKRK